MKENKKIIKKSLFDNILCNLPEEEFIGLNQEDKEIYLFLRGGFAAK